MGITTAKIVRNFQVTVPRSVRKLVHLEEGDLVDFKVQDGDIIMTPLSVVKKEQAYAFSPEWQKAIKKSEEEISRGHYKVYRSGKDMERDIEG